MIRCENCGRKTAPGEKTTTRVQTERTKVYTLPGDAGFALGREIVKTQKVGVCCKDKPVPYKLIGAQP